GKMILQFSQSGKRTHLVETLMDLMTRELPPCSQVLEQGCEIGGSIRRYTFEGLSAKETKAIIDMGHSLSVGCFAVGTDFAVREFDIARVPRSLVAENGHQG